MAKICHLENREIAISQRKRFWWNLVLNSTLGRL